MIIIEAKKPYAMHKAFTNKKVNMKKSDYEYEIWQWIDQKLYDAGFNVKTKLK